MRPADLPSPAQFLARPCGTRAKYVAGCRCDRCRAANVRRYHRQQAEAITAARSINTPPTPAPQIWTAPDGTKRTRIYTRACPGVNGAPCRHHRHLRKDSKGGVCGDCRLRLVWNGLVPAATARQHLQALSRRGVGRRAVRAACDVADTLLQEIRNGTKQQIRRETERRILAVDVDARGDGALVPAGKAWRRIKRLLAEGFTQTELARRLGSTSKTPALQLRRTRITARTALRVEQLYWSLMVGG